MKLQRARAIVLRVHTIQHQRVNMDVQIERRPKPLNDGHRAATPVHDAWRSRACLLRKPSTARMNTPTIARHRA